MFIIKNIYVPFLITTNLLQVLLIVHRWFQYMFDKDFQQKIHLRLSLELVKGLDFQDVLNHVSNRKIVLFIIDK